MKYGKMVRTGHLPFTTEETDSFREKFVSLCKKWACIELGEVSVAPGYDDSVVYKVNFKLPVITRNMYKSRVNAKSIMFCISKNTGYIDNYDWVKKVVIDTTKDRHDYDSAPAFQYTAYLRVIGTEIKFRCRLIENICGGGYFYGTEFADFEDEINFALYEIFRNILR